MMLHHPYYYFNVHFNNSPPYYGLDVFVSDEFIKFAKHQDLRHEDFESFSEEAIKRFYGKDFVDLEVLSWVKDSGDDTGLLHSISIPGNSSQGMSLEEDFDTRYYHSHNIDSEKQFSFILTIISHYIGFIGKRLEFNSFGFDEEL